MLAVYACVSSLNGGVSGISGCSQLEMNQRLDLNLTLFLQNAAEKLGHHPSRTVDFYCFNLPENSDLTFETLKEVGIYSPHDAGAWLVQTLGDKLDQQDLATKLDTFLKAK